MRPGSAPPTALPGRAPAAGAGRADPGTPVGPGGVPPPPAWRALLVGSLLVPVTAFCAVYGYTVIQAVHWSQQSLKMGPICLLAGTILLNALARRIRARFALTSGELAVVYAMVVAGTAVGGIGWVQFHVTGLPAPFYFTQTGANPTWARFLPLIPQHFAVRDPDVAAGLFKGGGTLYTARVLAEWAVPVLFWGLVLLTLFWSMLCLNTLIRRQWIEGERLAFPLVQLPLEMIREGGASAFWRSPLMWGGFLLAGSLESLNSLNYLFPSVPTVWLKAAWVHQHFASPPWNGMGPVAVAFYPFMIGVTYLLTLEVSMSCWLAYLLTRTELVVATQLGWKDSAGGPALGSAPYLMEQAAGAFLGLAVFALWTARGSLRASLRSALRGTRAPGEPLPPRLAWLGALAGLALVTGLFAAAGLAWWLALALFVIYFLFQLTLTRIVAEAGAGWHYGPGCNAHELLFRGLGFGAFAPRDLTVLAYLNWIDMEYRDTPMPHQLEAMRLAAATGVALRRLAVALLLAAVLGIIFAYWANLHIYYKYGAATAKVRPWPTMVGQIPFRQLSDWLNSARPPHAESMAAVGAGAGITALLGVARQRFSWWPMHPVGYALANTMSMDYMWMPFFLGWLAKAVTLRYGGMRLYRKLLPFFCGLILGDYVVPGLWFLAGWATRTQMYMSFPH